MKNKDQYGMYINYMRCVPKVRVNIMSKYYNNQTTLSSKTLALQITYIANLGHVMTST